MSRIRGLLRLTTSSSRLVSCLFGGLLRSLGSDFIPSGGGLSPCPFGAERGLQVSGCLQGKSFTCFITPCLPVNDASCSCLKHDNLPLSF